MKPRSWAVMLGVGATLLAVGALGGIDALGAAVLVVAIMSALAIRRGVRRYEPPRAGPWRAFAAGIALLAVGEVVNLLVGVVTGDEEPFPSIADVLFYAGFGSMVLALALFIKSRSREGERPDRIDGLILAAGLGVVQWSYFMSPLLAADDLTRPERAVNFGYSLFDLAITALVARLAIGNGSRSFSYWLVATAAVVGLTSNLLSTLDTLDQFHGDTTIVLTAGLSFLLIGVAALHPSMARLTEPLQHRETRLTVPRAVAVTVAVLLAPAVLVAGHLAGDEPNLGVIVGGWAAVLLLVMARLADLVRAQERKADRESVLREASEALVVATSRQQMLDAALVAVRRVAGDSGRWALVALPDADGGLEVVASSGRGAWAPGTPVDHVLPPVLRGPVDTGASRVLALPGPSGGYLLFTPLVSRGELRGAVLVGLEDHDRDVVRAVDSLATEVALGLESAALTESLHRRRSERRFRALIERASDVVSVIGPDGRVSFVSPACHHVLGRRESEFLGEPAFPFVHPDDAAQVAACLVGGVADPREIRLRHADGDWRWFELTSGDLRDDPEVEGWVLNAREITDRRTAQQRLERSEARFRSLVQHSSDVVATIDDDGLFGYMSPSVSRVLGYTADALLGRAPAELVHQADRHKLDRSLERLLDGTRVQFGVELRVRDLEGEWKTLELTFTDLRSEPAVGAIVVNAHDITERKALEHDLRHQALHDELTGLANRVKFTDRVAHALAGQARRPEIVAVLFVDLDDFKTINDSLGHAAGDALLAVVAARLRTSLRATDTAARLGGDEFAVLLEGLRHRSEVLELAEILLSVTRAPVELAGRSVVIGASIGIAIADEHSRSADVLLRNADSAMYVAKDRGKNRFELFEQDMHTRTYERLELKGDLVHALERGELRVFYQPIVTVSTGRVRGFEALLRWMHPVRGMVSPASFIPLAEEVGAIVPIGRWVLDQAVAQLAAWQRSHPAYAPLHMSVNLSVRQLADPGIVGDIEDTLARHGVAPEDLTMEVTESILLGEGGGALDRLQEIRALGVQLAADDFGTGYSSLSHVQRFPFDVIKIDRTFVDALEGDDQTGLVPSIIELARRLGATTVAEGIESSEQLSILRRLQCDLGQGYFFAKPMPPGDVEQLLVAPASEPSRPEVTVS